MDSPALVSSNGIIGVANPPPTGCADFFDLSGGERSFDYQARKRLVLDLRVNFGISVSLISANLSRPTAKAMYRVSNNEGAIRVRTTVF